MDRINHNTMNRPEFMIRFHGKFPIELLERIERENEKILSYIHCNIDSEGFLILKPFGPEIEDTKYNER